MALANRLAPTETAERLEAWLATRLPEAADVRVDGVSSIQSSGFSTEAVMFDARWREAGRDRHERLAARVAPVGPGLFPDYDLDQECRVMTALADHSDLPVPAVLFHERDPGVLGSAFLVMQRVEGRRLGDDPPFTTEGWLVEMAPDDQAIVYDNVLRVMADLHSVDSTTLGLGNVGPPDAGETPLERQISYLRRFARFVAGSKDPDPLVAAGIEWLEENKPTSPEPTAFCWGDARFANVIVGDDLSIVAAVDWEEATIANPELDLGYFLFALRAHTEAIGVPPPPGFPNREATVARYQELSGRAVADLDYYELAATVRGALIMTRITQMMIEAGFLPVDSDLLANNPITQLLAGVLDVPAPGGPAAQWFGRRG